MHKKTNNWKKRFEHFININIWVQKVKIKAYGWWYLLEIINRIFEVTKTYVDIYLFGLLINELIRYATSPTKDLSHFIVIAAWYLGLGVIKSLLNIFYYSKDWMYSDFIFGWYIDELTIRKLTELDWERIENPTTEKNINESGKSRYSMKRLARIHLDIATNLLGFVIAFGALKVPPFFILLILLKVLPSIIMSSRFNAKAYKLGDSLSLSYNIMGNLFYVFRNYKSLFEVKIAAATESIYQKYKEVQQFIFRSHDEHRKQRLLWDFVVYIYGFIFQLGFYIYFVNQFLIGVLSIGTLQAMINTIDKVSNSINGVLQDLSNTINEFQYVKYLYNLLIEKNTQKDGTLVINTDKIEIVFDNVWFKYPLSKRYSLRGVSVTIRDNARIALVGENGAGKSTFLKLLTRVHVPTKGTITLNGKPLGEYKRDSLLKALSYMTQEFAQYGVLTAKDNITVYEHLQNASQENLLKAAKLSTSAEFIDTLPNKYDTVLNKVFDRGANLSTGQWQRLAVGRQFYANRPLVILDEPTSAIDPIAESKIFENLYEHVKDKTVIVVSHRYNTVRAAKEILVFKDGQIIERGSHHQLMDLKGYYANAYEVQNAEKKL